MAQLKELFLIETNERLQCYDVTENPNVAESSSDVIGFSVSTATTNEFYYDEDFAVPFDANLTDGQVEPLEDSLLLYSSLGGIDASQCLQEETILSPYRTVIDLSDSELEIDQSVIRLGSSSSEVGSENYWGTDSRLLRGCGISVEHYQPSVDMKSSDEDLNRSLADSLAQETDCGVPKVRLTTWAKVGNGSVKNLNMKPEFSETEEIETSSDSDESDKCESRRLVTWAGPDKETSQDPVVLENGLCGAIEYVDTSETSYMQNSGSQLALATGRVSPVAKNTMLRNGCRPQLPLAVGLTTWMTLVTSGRHGDGSSSGDWSQHGESESANSPQREESVLSPSSKDDGYDSVTKDLSIEDSRNTQDSEDENLPQCDNHLLEVFPNGGDGVESMFRSGVEEVPEILRQALAESRLRSSLWTPDVVHQGAISDDRLDGSLTAPTVEDQHRLAEAVDHLLHGSGLQEQKSASNIEHWDSLNSSISSSRQQSVAATLSSLAETSTSLSPSDTDAQLSLTYEVNGKQMYGAHTLPRLSKRIASGSGARNPEARLSFVYNSLLRPLPDLGFLRKSIKSDRVATKNLRICSETKDESVDDLKKPLVQNSESSKCLKKNSPERDSVERLSLGEGSSPLETENRGNSPRICLTSNRTRSSGHSKFAFSTHSSTSSGIDPGIFDLDDGYGTWNHRKSTLTARTQLPEQPWNLAALQLPKTTGGDSRDRKTDRLVVKVCNSCNARTVHLEEEKKNTPQYSRPLFADCKTLNFPIPPPKIIVSSADDTDHKNSAFDTSDQNENSRSGNTIVDIRRSGRYNTISSISRGSASYCENTDAKSFAFDIFKSGERSLCDIKRPYQRPAPKDGSQSGFTSDAADRYGNGIESLVSFDKGPIIINSGEARQQQLLGSSNRQKEFDEECENRINPKNVDLHKRFDQQNINEVRRMKRADEKEKEVPCPRAYKNVSILENGVRFRPGSTASETSSQFTDSKTIRIAPVDKQKLQKDVIGPTTVPVGVWKSTTVSREIPSPVDDKPPLDFLISSLDTDSSRESKSSMGDPLTKKTDLLLNAMRSVDVLLGHFNRHKTLKGQTGSTMQIDRQVGHLVLDHLCPALLAILLDGLRPELHGLFGTFRNSVRQVIEDSVTLGHPSNLVRDLVTSLKRLQFLNTPALFFNAFVFALLNCKALDFWLCYVHSHASLLQKHYTPASFLLLSHSTAGRSFQDLIAFLRPLALVPFRLEYNFEVKLLEEQLMEKRTLERQLVTTGACSVGLVAINQNFSTDNNLLLEDSRKLAEERTCLGSAESRQYSSIGTNQPRFFTFETQREESNEVGSTARPPVTPRSSPEVAETRMFDRHFVAINDVVKYTPDYRDHQGYAGNQSPLCQDQQLMSCNKQMPLSAASSAVLTQHSSALSAATRTLWSDYRLRFGLVRNRLERFFFGSG